MFKNIDKFWEPWSSMERSIFKLLLSLFFICLIAAIYFVSLGIHQPIEAVPMSKTEAVDVSYRNIDNAALELPVTAKNYIVIQTSIGSAYKISLTLGQIIFWLQLIITAILLAALTYIQRFWFMIVIAAVVVILIALQIDQLLVFGWDDKNLTFGLTGLVVLMLYYLHAFEKSAHLGKRILFMLLLLVPAFVVIILFAEVDSPELLLVNTFQIFPLIATVLLFVSIGPDLIYWILYLLTKSKNQEEGTSNIMHLMLMGAIYIIYLTLTYAYRNSYLYWDLIYLNEFLIGGIVLVLGIWGVQRRHELFSAQIGDKSTLSVIYLSMSILALTCLSWVFISGNDPMMETFEDLISVSQIAFGGMFLIYVIYNFHKPIRNGMQVYKIVYKPATLPYFTYRFGGFIVFIAILARASFFPAFQSFAGYYNGIADFYRSNQKFELSNLFYTMSMGYAGNNHKANYSRGYDYMMRVEDYVESTYYFNKAKNKNASPFTYLNLSHSRQKGRQLFDGVFDNQAGLAKFPNDGYLLTNMGYLYQQVEKRDSAFYYYQKALGTAAADLATTNKLAFFTKYNFDIQADTLVNNVEISSIEILANQLALANKYRLELQSIPEFILDTNLSYTEYALMNNRAIYAAKEKDNGYAEVVKAYLDAEVMSPFKDAMRLGLAHQKQAMHEIERSFFYLRDLVSSDFYKAGEYYYLYALWAFEQQAYALAIKMADKAIDLKYYPANSIKIFANIYLGDRESAKSAYENEIGNKSIDMAAIQSDPLYKLLFEEEVTDATFAYFEFLLDDSRWDEKIVGTSFEHFARMEGMQRAISALDTTSFLNHYDQIQQLESIEQTKQKADMLRIMFLRDLQQLPTISNSDARSWASLAALVEKGDTKALIDFVAKNPYFSFAVVYVANLAFEQGLRSEAYNLLVDAVLANPDDIYVQKAYSFISLKHGARAYAADTYTKLISILSGSERELYQSEFERIKSEVEQNMSEW